MGLQAVGNALQLLLVFEINVRPQDDLRSLAIEIPAALGATYIPQLNRLKPVVDLRREQVSVLIANISRRSFELDEHPPVALETLGRLQAFFFRLVCFLFAGAERATANDTQVLSSN